MTNVTGLIVDDSAVMRKIVERALRQAGIEFREVHAAGNGEDALAILRERPAGRPVDIIVSDICMPRMDGLEFVRIVRQDKLAEGTPIVMITTESSEEHVRTAIANGAQGYIRKPFTPDHVRSHVVPLLARSLFQNGRHADA